MLSLASILIHGAIMSAGFSILVLGLMWYNPRLVLNPGDMPPDVYAAAGPKTPEEKRLSLLLGVPGMLLMVAAPVISTWLVARGSGLSFWQLSLHAFGVMLIPFLFDLLVLDFLLFCTITPRFMVIPGTEGFAGYKDKMFHVRGHARGLVGLVIAAPIVAGLAMWLA